MKSYPCELQAWEYMKDAPPFAKAPVCGEYRLHNLINWRMCENAHEEQQTIEEFKAMNNCDEITRSEIIWSKS